MNYQKSKLKIMRKIKILHHPTKQKPFLIIYKPKDIPSAPLKSDDTNNALTMCIKEYPEIKNIHGKKEIEYGLLHRIDTATEGLLLIATTQEFYDYMQIEQEEGRFTKFYTALCEKNNKNAEFLGGFPEQLEHCKNIKTINITSFFRPYGKNSKEVRPVTQNSSQIALKKVGKQKIYTTEFCVLEENSDKEYLIQAKLTQGYRHQVRCHLAWLGFPIIGDEIYNSNEKNCQNSNTKNFNRSQMYFSATKIEFEYPKGDLNSYEISFTWT